MKVNIIGPSGSGKTFLAKKLSAKLKIIHINLDYVFFKHVIAKSRIELDEKIWSENLDRILKQKNWIIEGVNPILEVFEQADKIIYLKPGILTSLFRQWKRYFTDPVQRRQHGFKNNIILSKFIIKQYLQDPNPKKMSDPKYFRVKKVDKLLTKYKEKVVDVTNRNQINNLLSMLQN